MSSKWITAAGLVLIVMAGCRTTPRDYAATAYQGKQQRLAVEQDASLLKKAPAPTATVSQVSWQQNDHAENSQDDADYYDDGLMVATPTDAVISHMTVEEFEQVALATNPAVQQIAAEIEALRGKLTQAGLPPNPTAGIVGSDINEDGVSAGRYGVYFGREIVRGNKLGRSQSVVCAEIEAAEQRLATVQQRLLTDVRQRFYELLVAQEKVVVATELVSVSQKAVDTSKQLFEAKEAAQTAVLQSELELQNAKVTQRQAENEQLAARRKLAGLINEADLPPRMVAGNVREITSIAEFEQSFDLLVNSSPEIAALFAEVEQARRQLARECVEAVPNVTWQASLQHDFLTDDVIPGFQIGMPIPILNRNQGGIHQARYQITAAQRKAEKRALDLRQRLATAYETYLDAKLQVDAYSAEILPKAKETFDLISQGYSEGEIDFLQLLTAQRTYSQTNLNYLESLRRLWQQNVNIRGMLLSDSLQ